jgi:hypothetical protein
LAEARFFKKEYYPPLRMEIAFAKPAASQNAMKAQTLLLTKPVKKFATDQNE